MVLDQPNKDDLYTSYPGRLVFKELVLTSKIIAKGLHKYLFRTISLIHALVPFFLNLALDLQNTRPLSLLIPKYSSWQFWLFTISALTVNTVIYYINLLFIEIGVIDMRRRLAQMQTLNAVLETNRMKLKNYFQVFPLQNYFDP